MRQKALRPVIQALDHVLMFVPSVRPAAESGQGICQIADPFGNLFGLIGGYNPT